MSVREKLDELAKITPEFKHINYIDTFEDAGIYIIKPGRGHHDDPDSPLTQLNLMAGLLPVMADALGVKSVAVDTHSSWSKEILYELAMKGLHKTSRTKSYTVMEDGKVLSKIVSNDRRDYQATQGALYASGRNAIIQNPSRKFHYFSVCHQGTILKGSEDNRVPVAHGPDAGGPATIEEWGKQFGAVIRVFVQGSGAQAKRYIQTDEEVDAYKVPLIARVNTGGDSLPVHLELPKNNYDGNVKVAEQILNAMGVYPDRGIGGNASLCIYGIMGAGKTRVLSSFLGIQGMLPAIYVAADGDSEYLRSVWNQLKGLA